VLRPDVELLEELRSWSLGWIRFVSCLTFKVMHRWPSAMPRCC